MSAIGGATTQGSLPPPSGEGGSGRKKCPPGKIALIVIGILAGLAAIAFLVAGLAITAGALANGLMFTAIPLATASLVLILSGTLCFGGRITTSSGYTPPYRPYMGSSTPLYPQPPVTVYNVVPGGGRPMISGYSFGHDARGPRVEELYAPGASARGHSISGGTRLIAGSDASRR